MSNGRRLVIATGLALMVAGTAFAGGTCPGATVAVPPGAAALLSWKPKPWRPAYPLVQAAMGMRVQRDPVTGQLEMPQGEITGELARIGEDAPVMMDLRADGSRRAHLDERHAEFAVVRIDADGRPTWTCVHSRGEAEQFLKNRPTPINVPLPLPGTTWEVK